MIFENHFAYLTLTQVLQFLNLPCESISLLIALSTSLSFLIILFCRMVIVTDSNFLDAAGTLRKGLLYCDFVAIDFEFLGLDVSAISLHDTVESRYQILRDNVIKYRPCQLGLTLFKQKSNRA